ncbi:MAG: PRC-barrel domain-containing protein [Chloroflexota bacterium]|nr:PRC-barrel domain-containing protein [Chloroflexota bacterium]MDQ5867082.1 PRC-barrel domain-containing protein [Chloroflexota bacterium]
MDKRAREILGLPVVTMNRGTKIYDIEDMVIDPDRGQVLALVVQEAAWLHSARAIPFGRINVIGQDAVVIPDGRAVIEVNRDPVLKRLYNQQIVRGLRVLTDDGRRLGTVADMTLDSKTGEIKGYFVSLGFGTTMGQGARWLPAERVISIGQRVMFVPADVAQLFEQQIGGISGALDNAGDKLRSAGAKLNTQLEQIGTQVRDTVPARVSGSLVGRTAHQVVRDRDGNAIIVAGDTITQETVDAARAAGRMPQLMMAAGAGPTQNSLSSLGDQAAQSLRDIPNEARALWNQLTGGYNRRVDMADTKAVDRRVKDALGRPVTRVILDADDNIILNTGDIVTNHAIQAARQAGVLDILIDSIYTARPKLETQDLKAPRSGDASLEHVSGQPIAPQPDANANAPEPQTAGRAAGGATVVDNGPAGV